jgi:hypothetical protein
LLVGKTSQTGTGAGIELEADGTFYVGKTGDVATFNRTTAVDGTLIAFQKQGVAVGSIGSEGGDALYIQSGTTAGTGLLFISSGATIRPARNGATVDATLDLGSNTRRFKDLYLSGGVYGNSNALKFSTNAGTTQHMTLDTSGNLLVSKTSNNFGVSGAQFISGNGGSGITSTNIDVLGLNRLGTEGRLIGFITILLWKEISQYQAQPYPTTVVT